MWLPMVGFLYGQTEYNLLENVIHLDDYISSGVKNGYNFLSITDNNLYGHYKFYKKCLQNNIVPLLGLKVNLHSRFAGANYVLIYALNRNGYRNLMHLTSIESKNGVLFDEEIIKYNDGIALVTAAMDGDFEKLIYEKRYDEAEEELERLLQLTKHFYIGIMPGSFLFDTICDEEMAIVEQYDLKYLPLAKTCYLTEDDSYAYETLLKINDPKKSLGLDDFHFRSKEELIEEFMDYPLAFQHLEAFFKLVEKDIVPQGHKLPVFKNNLGLSSSNYLQKLAQKGLEKRLNSKNIPRYYERLNYELNVINKMGYDDYFLIVWDFIKYAKTHNIMVGPGRGSAAGSLVAYSLGITEIDPLKHDLLFERFLNPERVSMPDIDTDFEDIRRDDVIKYVKEKYGLNHVCYISAFGTFQIKSAIRDLFRVFGYDSKYIEPIINFLQSSRTKEEIENEFSNHPELINLISIAQKLEGLPRHVSTHAAGIIISGDDLFDTIPLREGLNGLYQAQLEASDLEELGMLKIDFLGIRNLTLLKQMVNEINRYIPSFKLKNIPLDDKDTFNLFANGDTLGIFQFESRGMVRVLKDMKPSSFEDIVAILALYRPGPMDQIATFIENKKRQKINYLHEDLAAILAPTYGVIVYQEQIMRIAQKFAGYSLGEADILRRAVSKKKRDVLELERTRFVKNATQRGYSSEVSNAIYDYIVKFADYGFNRNHSVAYGLLAYQIAYIKTHYLKVFMAKMLDNAISNDSETVQYIDYVRKHGIKLLPFDINKAGASYLIIKEGLIPPLGLIKGMGVGLVNTILEERKKGLFKDAIDFKKRLHEHLNEFVLNNLIDAGCFDYTGKSHPFWKEKVSSNFELYISDNEMITDIKEYSEDLLRENEKKALGFNLKYDLFVNYQTYFVKYKATMPSDFQIGKTVNVIGVVSNVRVIKTKKNENMAFIYFNANHEMLDVVSFSDTFNIYHNVFDSKGLVLINGVVRKRNDEIQVTLIKAKELN